MVVLSGTLPDIDIDAVQSNKRINISSVIDSKEFGLGIKKEEDTTYFFKIHTNNGEEYRQIRSNDLIQVKNDMQEGAFIEVITYAKTNLKLRDSLSFKIFVFGLLPVTSERKAVLHLPKNVTYIPYTGQAPNIIGVIG